MTKYIQHLILASLLAILAVGCDAAGEYETLSPEDCYEDEYYDEVDQFCYLVCDEGDDSCGEEYAGFLSGLLETVLGGSDFDEEQGTVLMTYSVDNNKITNPQEGEAYSDAEADLLEDSTAHEAMWRAFVQLIPAESRTLVSEYGIFTDGPENTMAYVEPNPDKPETWRLVMDPVDAENKEEQTYTLIHEYGHILTLNDRQVPFDSDSYYSEDETVTEDAKQACGTFFTGEGCSRNAAYINSFYDRFWADIYSEWEAVEFDPDSVADLYDKYNDRFLTDYAATNPGEDIAESWTHFVLKAKPNGDTIAEEKILFFYDYPELVKLRTSILGRLYSKERARQQ